MLSSLARRARLIGRVLLLPAVCIALLPFVVALALLDGCSTPVADGRSGRANLDGDFIEPEPIVLNEDGTVSTVAGTGAAGSSTGGLQAAAVQLDMPMDVAVSDDRYIWIADFNNHRIRRVDLTNGETRTMAGNGEPDMPASVAFPTGIRPLSEEEFIVVAWGQNQVLRYRSDSTRAVMLGDGSDRCFRKFDDFPAPEQSVVAPRSADILADNSVLVSEQGCHRVLRFRVDGSVEVYAGTGDEGYDGDDADAVDAMLHAGDVADGPSFGLSLSPEDPPDELFIADTANHVIRVVKPFTGRIETYAGTGEPGFVDGSLDVAQFNRPTHVFSGFDHSLWIVDAGNHAIRYVDPLQTRVVTVIGTGEAGFNGDDLPPNETMLNEPTSVFVTRGGDVYIADGGNHRIRAFQFTGAR